MRILPLILILLVLVTNTVALTDDWEYDPGSRPINSGYHKSSSFEYISIAAIIITAISGFTWIGISLYLITKGGRRRILGLADLLIPIATLLSLVILGTIFEEIGLLITIILYTALLVWGILFAIKIKAKIGIIPLLTIPLVVLCFALIAQSMMFGSVHKLSAVNSQVMTESLSANKMGLSVGGAKDANNFRKNIENGYLPLPSDLTFEGVFYDYYFDTGNMKECASLFCPSYSTALTKDPFSEQDEYYLSVGLNSGMEEKDFSRKKLNLVVVLDISGSMGSSFNQYYYDNPEKDYLDDLTKSKMKVASESVVGLLSHLEDDDRFGMVVFDNQAYDTKPVSLVSETDMESIEEHIMELNDRGGTNMEAGYKKGTEILKEYANVDADEYETRIIFLTDAMPNTGRIGSDSLLELTKKNSFNGIYTTFIGIGVDFNTELIEEISKVRGANYYSVHSPGEFKQRMDDEFEYMVTPLVFGLELNLEAKGYEIMKVYGSPEADESTGTIMKVNTLFPTASKEGEVKGGVVLLKLKKTSDDGMLKLTVDYEDRNGKKASSSETITFGSTEFENKGIRKAVLLSQYGSLLQNWMIDERRGVNDRYKRPIVNYDDGIAVPSFEESKWERTSVNLKVSKEYKELFVDFKEHFKTEMDELGDTELNQELELLDTLIKLKTEEPLPIY